MEAAIYSYIVVEQSLLTLSGMLWLICVGVGHAIDVRGHWSCSWYVRTVAAQLECEDDGRTAVVHRRESHSWRARASAGNGYIAVTWSSCSWTCRDTAT